MICSALHKDDLIPTEVWDLILKDIEYAFEPQYICNDTKWFTLKDGKAKPCVVNQAEFISKRFQSRLREKRWSTEMTLDEQRIDAYIDIPYKGLSIKLDSNELKLEVSKLNPDKEDYISSIYRFFYSSYIRRRPIDVDKDTSSYFNVSSESFNLRVGLEFETGNIASSFRAISKLNFLYETNHIDLAVFVTCKEKSDATRIWPSSNRNGSITELKQRRFMTQIKFPCMVIGFAPDGYSVTEPYINRNGQTYQISLSDEFITIGGVRYRYSYDRSMVTPA